MSYEVTIGIPVYNVEKYILQTLESALAQSFQSIEFLICDDCGTDSSMNIVREYQKNHPRGNNIRIVCQPRNMGVSAARNRLIDEAKGRFLYFMDSDDIIEPYTIALLVDNQNKYNADIVFGSYDKIETYLENRREKSMQYPLNVFWEEDQLATFAFRKYGGIQASACNYLVSLKLLHSIGLRFIDINYWEDMAFTYELVTYCKRAVMLPDITYHYICRYDSLSNYQQRMTITKDEILRNLKAVTFLKERTKRLKTKIYYPLRCNVVMMTDFYVLCNVLKNYQKITPSFTKKEMKDVMTHPATLSEILRFKKARLQNLLLYILGHLPSGLMVVLVEFIGHRKGLI
jgi:glycosyltransferase involved in cell wall biosynthesis